MSIPVLNEALNWEPAQLTEVIKACLAEPYRYSDNLRCAAMHMPFTLTTAQWVEVCSGLNINKNTARYALWAARVFQREVGEIK